MESLSAVIAAGISFAVCLVIVLLLVAMKRFGWASLFIGACIACAWVFALEWHELKRARAMKQPPFTTTH